MFFRDAGDSLQVHTALQPTRPTSTLFSKRDFSFSQRRVWVVVDWYESSDVSEMLTTSIIRVTIALMMEAASTSEASVNYRLHGTTTQKTAISVFQSALGNWSVSILTTCRYQLILYFKFCPILVPFSVFFNTLSFLF
jgi:hypothetical protein